MARISGKSARPNLDGFIRSGSTFKIIGDVRNDVLLSAPLNDNIIYMSLLGKGMVDFTDFRWPPNLRHLHTNFRPKLSHLPSTLRSLKFRTQNMVLKSELPPRLKTLILYAPNNGIRQFNVRTDGFEVYFISIQDYSKYNVFIGGYLGDSHEHSIDQNYVWYYSRVEGDTYLKVCELDLDTDYNNFNCDYDLEGNLRMCQLNTDKISSIGSTPRQTHALKEQIYMLRHREKKLMQENRQLREENMDYYEKLRKIIEIINR
jgi:hypothetical protein